jgi:uncharacterized protein with gpF-like domain
MTRQEQFAQKVQQLIASAQQLAPEARSAVMDLLNQARQRILAQLADSDPSSFSTWQLRNLKNSVDQAMQTFQDEATKAIAALQTSAARLGSEMAGAPLASTGLSMSAIGGVDASTLAIAQGYTADLITGLSKDSAARINAIIQRAFLGGQSVTDIIDQVGRALNNGKDFGGIFSQIGKRAETIAVNEVLRVHSIAQMGRLTDMAGLHPGLKKQWKHLDAARIPRPLHIAADGQVREVGEPFHIGGEALMYPRDPNGSPENTINCHCLMTPFFADEDLQPSAAQRGLLDSLGISVVRAA